MGIPPGSRNFALWGSDSTTNYQYSGLTTFLTYFNFIIYIFFYLGYTYCIQCITPFIFILLIIFIFIRIRIKTSNYLKLLNFCELNGGETPKNFLQDTRIVYSHCILCYFEL